MNFRTKKSILSVSVWIYLAASLALSILRTYTVYTRVDPETGFYHTNADLANAFYLAFAVLTVVMFLIACICNVRFGAKKKTNEMDYRAPQAGIPLLRGTKMVFSPKSTSRIFISVFCGFSLITFSFLSLVEMELSFVEVLIQLLGILSGFYLLLQVTPVLPLYSFKRTLSSLIPILWSLLNLVSHFFSSARSATGEYHAWQILTLICLPIFFYLQTLFTLPEPALHRLTLLLVTGVCGAGFALIHILPTLVLSSFWYYSTYTQYTTLYEQMCLLAAALYLLVFSLDILASLRRVSNPSERMESSRSSENVPLSSPNFKDLP